MIEEKYIIKSKLLKTFVDEIQYKNRNPRDNRVLQLLDDKATNPERILTQNDKLYRCRIVKNNSKVNMEKNFFGLNAAESFIAPAEKTKDKRANYKNIPYLYCANHPYTTLVETRPQVGSKISIATISIQEEIKLLDFTLHVTPQKKMIESKINLFSDLSYLFSKPVAIEDDTIDYIPTQYIAEYAKNLGYDGIAFQSSLTPELSSQDVDAHPNLDRYNAVIFNYEKCLPIKSNLYRVCNQYIECDPIDEDDDPVDVHTTILDMYY